MYSGGHRCTPDLGRPDPWSADVKASDEFLNPLLIVSSKNSALPNLLRKTDYHALARLVPKEKIDPKSLLNWMGFLPLHGKLNPRKRKIGKLLPRMINQTGSAIKS